jgi:uncharacterized protein YqgC (DUF456 family)
MTKNKKRQNFSTWIVVVGLIGMTATGCAGGPLTAREKGAGIGALGGAAVGGVIGNAKGHPGAGAAIGGAVGLGAGALIGNYIQGQEDNDYRR